ncbi:SseB family protein [Actinoallomurus sp. WRP6H-15]|nr:SseB family protein [Actinoallomurus soli]
MFLIPHFTAGAEFVPLDEEERLLYEAAARDDREEFLRTLLGVRQIWVPMVEGGDLMLGPGRPGFEWYTRESDGRTVVPLFTGPSRMREAMGGHPFVLSDLTKVLRFWPDSTWDLVINDGSPIGATIPGERITALSRQVDDAAAQRLAGDFPAQNDAERRLFEARNDPAMRLTVLLEASVFLPVWSRTPPTVQTPPTDPAFPWSAVPVRGRSSVLVFTSFDWMKEAVGTTGFVMPKFADLIATWPEPSWDVSVNPGTPIEIALSAEEIGVIAGRPAARPPEAAPGGVPQDPAAESPQVPATPQAPAAPETPAAPEASVAPPAPAAPGAPVAPEAPIAPQPEAAAVVEAPTAPAEVQPAPLPQPAAQPAAQETAPPSDGGFTIMQKVVAHDQVAWYLEKAYDRVAGFVHRVPDVIDLNTPRRLYECLGLVRDGSPFSPEDSEVHIIRWPAYRAGLYRTPFGGTSEDALKEWGEDGWVVEAPPFTGDGFASGSAGSIPEFKVESFRLPHGSEMYAISSDGSERFVARYDADRLVWENEK